MIGEVLEEKLCDLLGDPDEGLEIRPEIRDRLLKGLNHLPHETISASAAARRLGLEWQMYQVQFLPEAIEALVVI
jgi:hypothetical protein